MIRRSGFWIGAALAGVLVLVTGLALDGVMHARNPNLVHEEGLFTLSNPGHLLIFIGTAVATGAMILAGWLAAASAPVRVSVAIAGIGVVGGAGLILLWAARQPVAAAPAPRAATHAAPAQAPAHDHQVPPDTARATPEQAAAAAKLLADTKAAMVRFNDLAAATADGYLPVTPPGLPIVHYVNPAYMNDGRILDPQHPESLIYVNTRHGAVLVGAMYLMPATGMPGPDIGGPLTPWHKHTNLCFATDTGMIVALTDATGACPAGTVNRMTPEMLHVWIVDNPEGPFSENMNPAALAAAIR